MAAVDDTATIDPPPGVGHVPTGVLDHQERGGDVEGHHVGELLGLVVEHRGHTAPAGDRHGHVELAGGFGGQRHRGLHLGAVGGVAGGPADRASGGGGQRSQIVGGLLEMTGVVAGDHHMGTVGHQQPSGGPTDAARPAGDQGGHPGQRTVL